MTMKSKADQALDFPANPIEKPGYLLEFIDDFRDTVLNRDKWLPLYLPQWSNKKLSSAHYSLSGHNLRLHIEVDQPAWCPEYDGKVRVSSLQTGCFSGPVGSGIGQHKFNPKLVVTEAQATLRHYTPQYGYFESRLKAVPIAGYMVALWMIGFEEHPEESAEICICEIFGNRVARDISQIGYGVHPFNDPAIENEFYQEDLEIDASNYHIYAAEWTPRHVDFYVDNVRARRIEQSPNYPMQFMLGIYELPGQLGQGSQLESWPKTFEVDYVRGYQPIDGYGQSVERNFVM